MLHSGRIVEPGNGQESSSEREPSPDPLNRQFRLDAELSEGRILAVKIASTVLNADIWLAFRDDFQPDEGEPLAVFYSHEIPHLNNKTVEELKAIHRTKLAFGPGAKMRQ